MHYESQTVNDKIKFFFELFKKNTFLCSEYMSYMKNFKTIKQDEFLNIFYQQLRFYTSIYPLIINNLYSAHTLHFFINLSQAIKEYGGSKKKLLCGVLRNGFLVELANLEEKQINTWFEFLRFNNLIDHRKKELSLKFIEFLKEFSASELQQIGIFFAEHISKISQKEDDVAIKKIIMLGLFSKVAKYLNSNAKRIKYEELMEEFVLYKDLKLDHKVITYLVKLTPVIVKLFNDEELILNFYSYFTKYNFLKDTLNEFKDNYNHFKDNIPDRLEDSFKKEEINISEDNLKIKFYSHLAKLLKNIYGALNELHYFLAKEEPQTKYFIEFILITFPNFKLAQVINSYNITSEDLYDIAKELTSENGQESINRYLNDPGKLNLFRLITDNHLLMKVISYKLKN